MTIKGVFPVRWVPEGKDGVSVHEVNIYQWANNTPATPTQGAYPPTGWYTTHNAFSIALAGNGDDSVVLKRIDFTAKYSNASMLLRITASSEEGYDYGIAGKLDTDLVGVSAEDLLEDLSVYCKAYASGTDSINAQYTGITAGRHYIYIAYTKDGSGLDENDEAIFDLISVEGVEINAISDMSLWSCYGTLRNNTLEGGWHGAIKVTGIDGADGTNGTNGKDAQFIYLKGTAYDSTQGASAGVLPCEIRVNGGNNLVLEQATGLNLVTINRTTLSVVERIRYNTYAEAAGETGATGITDLIAKLTALDDSVFVCLVSYDAVGWTTALIEALQDYGMSDLPYLRAWRYPFLFIGRKHLGKGYGITRMRDEGSWTNFVEVSVYIAGGALGMNDGGSDNNGYPRLCNIYDPTQTYTWNNEYRDFVDYNIGGSYYRFGVKTKGMIVPANTPPAAGGNQYWVQAHKVQTLITDTIFADNANIGGFMTSNQKMVSSHKESDNTPTTSLNGNTGEFVCNNAKIRGEVNATSGTFENVIVKGSLFTPYLVLNNGNIDNYSTITSDAYFDKLYLIDLEKTGLNVQFDFADTSQNYKYIKLPTDSKYLGAEANFLCTNFYVVFRNVYQGNGYMGAPSNEVYPMLTCGAKVKLKCISYGGNVIWIPDGFSNIGSWLGPRPVAIGEVWISYSIPQGGTSPTWSVDALGGFSAERLDVGKYKVWTASNNHIGDITSYTIAVFGKGYCFSGTQRETNSFVKATLLETGYDYTNRRGYVIIGTSDDASANDGDFYFILYQKSGDYFTI